MGGFGREPAQTAPQLAQACNRSYWIGEWLQIQV